LKEIDDKNILFDWQIDTLRTKLNLSSIDIPTRTSRGVMLTRYSKRDACGGTLIAYLQYRLDNPGVVYPIKAAIKEVIRLHIAYIDVGPLVISQPFPYSYTQRQESVMRELGIFPFNHTLRMYLDNMAQISAYWIKRNASKFKRGIRALLKRHYVVRAADGKNPTDDFAAMLVAPYAADKFSWSLRGRGVIPGATFERTVSFDQAIDLVSSMDTTSRDIRAHLASMDRFVHQIVGPHRLAELPLPPPPSPRPRRLVPLSS
jgi:hypothetical protein